MCLWKECKQAVEDVLQDSLLQEKIKVVTQVSPTQLKKLQQLTEIWNFISETIYLIIYLSETWKIRNYLASFILLIIIRDLDFPISTLIFSLGEESTIKSPPQVESIVAVHKLRSTSEDPMIIRNNIASYSLTS